MVKGMPHCYEFTEEEKERIIELRKRMSESDLNLTEEQREDSFLIRWLRARNLDVSKAEEMLRTSLEWRRKNNIDTILERESVPAEIMEMAPVAWCGVDGGGYPIFICPIGRHDARTMLEKYGIEYCKKINIFNMETICGMLRAESERQGRKITQIVEILDMDGYSYRQMSSKACRDFMIAMQQMMDCHYPELLRHAIIINAPKIFAVLFAMLKPFVPKNTLDKLEVYGPDETKWKKAIAERFPLENLPRHWGGTFEGVDEFCSGHEMWIQGPKDMKAFMNGVNSPDENPTTDFDCDYTTVTVNARDKVTKEVEISEKNTVLGWKFKTENYDIGFQIVCNANGENKSADSSTDSSCDKDKKSLEMEILEIFPYSRVDAHNSIQEGSHTCQVPGKYSFVFDNSFSLIKGKTLLYKIEVLEPSDEDDFKECSEF